MIQSTLSNPSKEVIYLYYKSSIFNLGATTTSIRKYTRLNLTSICKSNLYYLQKDILPGTQSTYILDILKHLENVSKRESSLRFVTYKRDLFYIIKDLNNSLKYKW